MDRPIEVIELLQSLRAQVPVATQKPGSIAEQVVGAIAGELNTWFGHRELQLALSDPIHSEQKDDDTVVVHFPGTEVIWSNGGNGLNLGDLVLTVTRFDETKYGFDTSLPSIIELLARNRRNGEQVIVTNSEISGVWRSDLETLTALDIAASEIRVANERQDLFGIGSLTVSSLSEQASDGLWNADSTITLSNFRITPYRLDEDFRIGSLNVAISLEDTDLDPFLAATRSEVIAGDNDEVEVLQPITNSILHNRLGRIEVEISFHAVLSLKRSKTQLGFGELSIKAMIDDRDEFADFSFALDVIEPQIELSEIKQLGIPPTIIPEAVKIEFALNRYPIRPIAKLVQELATPDYGSGYDRESLQNSVIVELANAGSLLDVRGIRIVAPNFEFSIEGELQAEPKSDFGVTGRMDTRIQGIDNILNWAVGRGEMEMSSVILLLRGLGKPIQYSDNDDPTYLYELNILSDSSVTLNDIPLGILLKELGLQL